MRSTLVGGTQYIINYMASSALWWGTLLLNRAACWRAIESFWKSLLVSTDSSSPVWRAFALANFFTSFTALGCQAPSDSTARGKKTIPCLLQGSQDLSSLRRWAACSAWPGVAAASFTIAACSGLTTVTSSAASLPWAQCYWVECYWVEPSLLLSVTELSPVYCCLVCSSH